MHLPATVINGVLAMVPSGAASDGQARARRPRASGQMRRRERHPHGGGFQPPRRLGSVQSLFVPLKAVLGDDMLCFAAPGQSSGAGLDEHDDFVAILEVGSINFGLLAPAEQEALILRFRALITALQHPIQVLIRIQPLDLMPYLRRLAAQADARAARSFQRTWPGSVNPHNQPSPAAIQSAATNIPPGDPLGVLAEAHRQHVQALLMQSGLLERRFYLVVPASDLPNLMAALPALTSPLFGMGRWLADRFRRQGRVPRSTIPQALERQTLARQQLNLRVAELTRQLNAMGLPVRRLRGLELIGFVQSCLMPRRAQRQPLTSEALATLDMPTQARVPTSWREHQAAHSTLSDANPADDASTGIVPSNGTIRNAAERRPTAGARGAASRQRRNAGPHVGRALTPGTEGR